MSKGAKIGILVVVAVVAFGTALLAFRGGGSSSNDTVASGSQPISTAGGSGPTAAGTPAGACPSTTTSDPSYKVAVEGAPKAEASVVTVDVTRDGKPVTGATVCVAAAMSGMSHAGIDARAKEMPGGRYQLDDVSFGMRGTWAGTVTVAESGKQAVSVPLTFDVQ